MFDAAKRLHPGRNIRRSCTREMRGRAGGKHVLEIVLATQRNFVSPANHKIRIVVPNHDLIALQERALNHSLAPAEPKDVRSRWHPLGYFRIVRIEHSEV